MLNLFVRAFTPMARKLPQVVETTRSILFQNKDVSVVCFRWKRGDGLPPHDHYGKCMFQVLDGKLLETRGNLKNVLYTNDVGKIGKGFVHSINPIVDSRSIHVYSPPPPCLLKK